MTPAISGVLLKKVKRITIFSRHISIVSNYIYLNNIRFNDQILVRGG